MLDANGAERSVDRVRKAIITESIGAYSGACACPYSVMRTGKPCGRRSAYSKPGGSKPKCYSGDVSAAEVEDYRRRHAG